MEDSSQFFLPLLFKKVLTLYQIIYLNEKEYCSIYTLLLFVY